LVGHRPNQLANCFSLGKALKSATASEITVCAVSTSMPDRRRPVASHECAHGRILIEWIRKLLRMSNLAGPASARAAYCLVSRPWLRESAAGPACVTRKQRMAQRYVHAAFK